MSPVLVPFMLSSIAAGFPSPAEDYLDRPLDFNELLIDNPPATFAVRISGESMIGIGLFPDDIAIVNRALDATHGAIVVALVDGEFTIKRYSKRGRQIELHAENPRFSSLRVHDDMQFEIWGVVTSSIRILHPSVKK
jgi:DNA polymerase V